MDIKVEKYLEELNKCMQMHPDYIEGLYAKLNSMERGIELYDAEGNKVSGALSKAFVGCDTKLALMYKLVIKK